MQIVFYTRPGCTLCDDARRLLERVCADLQWSEINVDTDPDLQASYGELVPVIEVDGERVGQWQIDEARLKEAIGGKRRASRRLFRRRKAR